METKIISLKCSNCSGLLQVNEKEQYKVRFRKKDDINEYISNLSSGDTMNSFIRSGDVDIISITKERPHLEEIIYRSKCID